MDQPLRNFNDRRHLWAIVLAGGAGRRMTPVTTPATGTAIPKQYCSLWGGPSLFQETLIRAQTTVAREKVCASVAEPHRSWWEPPLWALPRRNTIVQAVDRGNALGLLLPLLHILQRDPQARVMVLPSDHYVHDEAVFTNSLCEAARFSATHPEAVVMLGFEAQHPDLELGYVVPGIRQESGVFEVAELVEKPLLSERRVLRNGMVMLAGARALLGLYQRSHPNIVAVLQYAVGRDLDSPRDGFHAAAAFHNLPTLDFARDIVLGQEEVMRTLPVPECGWSDLSGPAALAAVLGQGQNRKAPARGPWSPPTLILSEQYFRTASAAYAGGGAHW